MRLYTVTLLKHHCHFVSCQDTLSSNNFEVSDKSFSYFNGSIWCKNSLCGLVWRPDGIGSTHVRGIKRTFYISRFHIYDKRLIYSEHSPWMFIFGLCFSFLSDITTTLANSKRWEWEGWRGSVIIHRQSFFHWARICLHVWPRFSRFAFFGSENEKNI